MNIKLKIGKTVHENAARYYEQAKEARKKMDGLKQAIEETKKEMIKSEKKAKENKKLIKTKKEKKWFEKLHWFYTSKGKMAIGGRNAQQNDQVVSKYMEDRDLFFHADIQGATVVILKDGIDAEDSELLETAQFAASFSNAWKNGNASVDVYAVKKDQLAKHTSGGYIPTGAFAITGERKWFKKMKMALRLGRSPMVEGGGILIVPENCTKKLENEVTLFPAAAGKDKGELTKTLAKRFAVHPDELMEVLPNGKTKMVYKD
ncbi:MAG: NFACT RNA binding domain-containing protein [Candidatus Micrarchaeota archaeon]|nr:NFACT RNA binding domain-containing protein [Candidatus Micrarchaeota archaeon]